MVTGKNGKRIAAIFMILLGIICIFTLVTGGMDEEDSRRAGGAFL